MRGQRRSTLPDLTLALPILDLELLLGLLTTPEQDTPIKSVWLKDFPSLHFASICFTALLLLFSQERTCHKHSD